MIQQIYIYIYIYHPFSFSYVPQNSFLSLSRRNKVIRALRARNSLARKILPCSQRWKKSFLLLFETEEVALFFLLASASANSIARNNIKSCHCCAIITGSFLFLFSAVVRVVSSVMEKNSSFFVRWRIHSLSLSLSFFFPFFLFLFFVLLYSTMTYIRAKVWVGLTEHFRVELEQARCSEPGFSPTNGCKLRKWKSDRTWSSG